MEKQSQFKVGVNVVRVSNDYTNGRTGPIIEIDEQKQRARVEWSEGPRTWVSFSNLVAEFQS